MLIDVHSIRKGINLSFMTILRRFLGPRAPRVEYPNLYVQLANLPVCYDIRQATDDELTMLWLNTTRLVDAVLSEMQVRGMDAGALIDETKKRLDSGDLKNNPDADKPFGGFR